MHLYRVYSLIFCSTCVRQKFLPSSNYRFFLILNQALFLITQVRVTNNLVTKLIEFIHLFIVLFNFLRYILKKKKKLIRRNVFLL